jgi:GT2 family glycosyltransferase
VSLIIPTRDQVELLRTCISSIFDKTDYPDFEVLIVDNQSSEPATLEYFAELAAEPRIKVVPYDAPFNYSAINNHAAALASGQILGLVNNDIEVESAGWLQEMVSQAVREDVGAVGAMLLYPNDTIQHAGVIVGLHGIAGHVYAGLPRNHPGQMGRALLVQEMSAVTAACLLVRKSVFDQVGGLDEGLSVAFNDIDFCLRVRARGYRNLWTPHAVLYHHESASRGSEDTPEKQARFNAEIDFMQSRWGDLLLRDPSYNPNLSLGAGQFELAFPPR